MAVHQYERSEPPVLKHSSKIKYGPKIEKKPIAKENSATARQFDVSKTIETYKVKAPE